MPVLARESLAQYARLAMYDSPYVAHRQGRAVDLFPGDRSGPEGLSVEAPSPVAGRVEAVRSVRAPTKPYADAEDHLVVVAVDGNSGGVRPSLRRPPDDVRDGPETNGDGPDYRARLLHVDPSVDEGDRVEVGEPLGRLVRSGYFAPWVDNHLHLGIRPDDADPVRASGSLSLGLDTTLAAVPWNGVGRVREVKETYVRLDAPRHPTPGNAFAGIEGAPGVALDGGLPHYRAGGAHVADPLAAVEVDAVRLAGYLVGTIDEDDESEEDGDGDGNAPEPADPELEGISGPAAEALAAPTDDSGGENGSENDGDGEPEVGPRDVTWGDVEIRANGEPVVGVSLTLGREDAGAKVVAPDHELGRGDRVELSVHWEGE